MRTKASIRYLNGYRLLYLPEHPHAMTNKCWLGYVYEHIVVAEEKLGRRLEGNEVAHHKDEDRSNNAPDNIEVKTRGAHTKEHRHPDGPRELKQCSFCKGPMSASHITYCSYRCSGLAQRQVERPTVDQLRDLLKTYSFCAVGRMFGVSDNAVRKWLKSGTVA